MKSWPLMLIVMLVSTAARADEAAPVAEPNDDLSLVPWIVGGVGAAALLTGGVLVVAGQLERQNASDSCAPFCHPDVQDSIRTKWIAGGLTATGGVLLGAIAAMSYAVIHTPSAKLQAKVGPTHTGLQLTWQY